MTKLTRSSFERARAAILRHARPVDVALFRYSFDHGGNEAVVQAVEAFQNGDGGFGRGIEPDFRLESSSVIGTVTAFHYLHAVDAQADDAVVQKGVGYLASNYRRSEKRWLEAPPEVNLYPHAPWWHHNGAAPEPGQWAIPGANVAATFHRYSGLVPTDLLEEVTHVAITEFDASPRPLGPYPVEAYLELAEAAPPAVAEKLLPRLKAAVRQSVKLTPEGWAEDHYQPFWLATTPDAAAAGVLRPELEQNLEWQIGRQEEDGLWQPAWDWSIGTPIMGCDCSAGKRRHEFESAWEKARQEWAGQVTVRTLRALQAHGLIEA